MVMHGSCGLRDQVGPPSDDRAADRIVDRERAASAGAVGAAAVGLAALRRRAGGFGAAGFGPLAPSRAHPRKSFFSGGWPPRWPPSTRQLPAARGGGVQGSGEAGACVGPPAGRPLQSEVRRRTRRVRGAGGGSVPRVPCLFVTRFVPSRSTGLRSAQDRRDAHRGAGRSHRPPTWDPRDRRARLAPRPGPTSVPRGRKRRLRTPKPLGRPSASRVEGSRAAAAFPGATGHRADTDPVPGGGNAAPRRSGGKKAQAPARSMLRCDFPAATAA